MPPKDFILDPANSSFTPSFLPKKTPSKDHPNSASPSPSAQKSKHYGLLHKEGANELIPVIFKNTISTQRSNFLPTSSCVNTKATILEIHRQCKINMVESYEVSCPESKIFESLPTFFWSLSFRDPVPLILPYFTPSLTFGAEKLIIKGVDETTSLIRCIKFYRDLPFCAETSKKLLDFKHPNVLQVHSIELRSDTDDHSYTYILTDFYPSLKTIEKTEPKFEDFIKILLSGISVITESRNLGIFGSNFSLRKIAFVGKDPIFLGVGSSSLFKRIEGDDWNTFAVSLYKFVAMNPYEAFTENFASKIPLKGWIRSLLSKMMTFKGDSAQILSSDPELCKAYMTYSIDLQTETLAHKQALIQSLDNGEIFRTHLRLQRVIYMCRALGSPIKELELFNEILVNEENLSNAIGKVHQYLSLFLCSSPLAIRLEKKINSKSLPNELIVISFAELRKRFEEAEILIKKN